MISQNPYEVLRSLGRDYNAEILAVTSRSLSADKISENADVPIGTTYRRIDDLVEEGLLELSGRELSEHSRRQSIYQRTFDSVIVRFEGQSMTLDIEERTEVQNKLDDICRSLGEH